MNQNVRGLSLLGFTQFWERLGFYTLQTILVLYLARGLGFSDERVYALYATFGCMLYLSPIIGGYIADRYLGTQRSILIGACLLILGYLVAALPGNPSLFLALSIIIAGTGLFQPYCCFLENRSPFFALIPPLLMGCLVSRYGWHSGFLVAAAGATISLFLFMLGKSRLRSFGALPPMSPLHHKKEAFVFYLLFYVAVAGSIGVILFLFHFSKESNFLLTILLLAAFVILLHFFFKEKRMHRSEKVTYLTLFFISVGVWALYNQTLTSLVLYAERHMRKDLFGIQIHTEFILFFGPFFVILLSPILGRLKNTPKQLLLGPLLMGLGFFVLGVGSFYSELSVYLLAGSYLLQTLGVLLVSAINLALIRTLGSSQTVRGMWFLLQGAAFALGGELALFAVSSEPSLATYNKAFLIYGSLSFMLAAASLVLIPYLKRHRLLA